jgi:hypothetical protein
LGFSAVELLAIGVLEGNGTLASTGETIPGVAGEAVAVGEVGSAAEGV